MINHLIKLLYTIFGLIDETDCTIPLLEFKESSISSASL